jgi:hypothetical protein
MVICWRKGWKLAPTTLLKHCTATVMDYLLNPSMASTSSLERIQQLKTEIANLPCCWTIMIPVLCLFSGCQTTQTIVTAPVSITVELRTVDKKAGHVLWILRNKSDQYLVYENRNTPESGIFNRFEVTMIDGREWDHLGIVADSFGNSEDFYTLVAPKAKIAVDCDIAEAYGIPARKGFKLKCETFLSFGFYASEPSAKAAIKKIARKREGVLPYFKELDTGWHVVDRL